MRHHSPTGVVLPFRYAGRRPGVLRWRRGVLLSGECVGSPMVDVPMEPSQAGNAGTAPRLIAVVPAYNEEPTVIEVLDRLSGLVQELVIVDDGSTDRTRELVQAWLPAHPHAELLTIDVNRGMSAAYY